jgi:hypothetical protein
MNMFSSPDRSLSGSSGSIAPMISEGDKFVSREDLTLHVRRLGRHCGTGFYRPKHIDNHFKGNNFMRYSCSSNNMKQDTTLYDGPLPARNPETLCPWHVVGSISQSKKEDLKGSVTVKSICLEHGEACNSIINPLTMEEALKNNDFVSGARGMKDKAIMNLAKRLFKHRPSQSFANRAKREIRKRDNIFNESEFRTLKSWLEQFVALNPGSSMRFNRGDDKVFKSCMVAHGCIVDIIEYSSYKVFALDAGFTHVRGWRGQVFVLTVTDGNHQIFPLACGLYGVESGDNYRDFLKGVKACSDGKLGLILNQPSVLIFTDRHKSFSPALLQELEFTTHMNDVKHIERNMQDNPSLNRLGNIGKIWSIAKAKSRSVFDANMTEFHHANPAAATYLDLIPHATWAFYTIIERGITTHLKYGSNDAESEQHRFNTEFIRRSLPQTAIINYVMLAGRLLGERAVAAKLRLNQDKQLTKYAEHYIKRSSELSVDYELQFHGNSTDGQFVVWHNELPRLTRTISWKRQECVCTHLPQQKLLPCKHLMRGAKELGMSGEQIIDHCVGSIYLMKNYTKAYSSSLHMPDVQAIVKDDTLSPPYTVRKGKIPTKRKKGRAERHFTPLKRTINDTDREDEFKSTEQEIDFNEPPEGESEGGGGGEEEGEGEEYYVEEYLNQPTIGDDDTPDSTA